MERRSTSQNPSNGNGNRNGVLNPNQPCLCEECGQNPSKYKCPGCSLRTCSLPCVKSHKQRTSCTGKRPTTFVPLSQFNDNLLISDYNFLEEAKRTAESAKRMRYGLSGYYGFKLPPSLKLLRSVAAHKRKTRVLFLPSGMSKREKNQSRYDQKAKSIFWTIEWHFHSTDVILMDNGVDENKSLNSVVEEHLKPGPWNHKLKPFCNEQMDSLKFFIQKFPKDPKSPFSELNIEASLRGQLSGIVIVEYPVIHVFLPSQSCDFEIERSANSFSKEIESAKSLSDFPSPKGVHFREEEPEEDDLSSDTQFLDLMTYMNSEPSDNFQMIDKEVALSKTKASEGTQLVRNNEGRAHHLEVGEYSCSNSKAFGVSDDMAFDFEQDLQDAYSYLIGQANPDDYLCLEGEFIENMEGTRGDQSGIDELFSREEELEEGEIVEF
ncbi:zinc finger protein [Cinnamomum micranthum f. kanehirae]|uniref:Box C/D snoRNA protein 1 n=1 Tax=Cinnamomum micranthum f. kanehirae TaxID=337451 RepID=A0A443Q2A9_9MAGN|nr:zinc finger protein [Cinnamomum micranthum f. kanehirae]